MALKLTVDSLDGIDEAHKALYEQDGDKFRLQVEGVEDTTGLKTALANANRESAGRRKKLESWEKLGKTPEEIEALLTAQEEAERKKAEDAGDHAKVLAQHQSKWAKEKADLEAELNAARSSERGAIIGHSVMTALSKEGATEEGVDLLPDRLASRIKFETKDGQRVLRIMQADGETPMAGSGSEGRATIDDLVKEAKQKWPSLFKGTGQSGSGTQPANGSGGTPQIKTKADLMKGATTKFEQMKRRTAFIDANGGPDGGGYAAYSRLADGGFIEASK